VGTSFLESRRPKGAPSEATRVIRRTATPVVLLALLLTLLPSWPAASAPAPGGWSGPVPLEFDDVHDTMVPQVAVDPTGNATAVWNQWGATTNDIWASRFTVGYGWGAPVLIETGGGFYARDPQVGVDALGNAIAVWSQLISGTENIWFNRYAVGTGWEGAVLVETNDTSDAVDPQVSVAADGTAVAVWVQSDGSQPSAWANRYDPGTGWGTAQLIEGDTANRIYAPQVALDGQGNAIAVWSNQLSDIWANRYDAATGWGTPERIENGSTGAFESQVGFDSSGNATAVWLQGGVWSNQFVVGSGWGAARRLDNGSAGPASEPQVAVAPGGDAMAAWIQGSTVWASRFVRATGWDAAQVIESSVNGSASGPQVGLDARGDAVAVWSYLDGGRYSVRANRYSTGNAWAGREVVAADNGSDFAGVQLGLDQHGDAVAVFLQTKALQRLPRSVASSRIGDGFPPAIRLASPAKGSTTNASTVWVTGTSEPGASVEVNGASTTAAQNGSFAVQIALAPGLKAILATAVDEAGNRASASVNVTVIDPLPAAEQAMADALVELAKAQADLNASSSALDGAQAALTAATANATSAQALVSDLEATAGAAEANRSAASANLTLAEAQLAALEADANATQTQLAGAASGLAAAQVRVALLENASLQANGELADAQANLSAAQAAIAGQQAAVTVSTENLSAARAALAVAQARVDTLQAQAPATGAGAAPAVGELWLALALALCAVALATLSSVVYARKRKRPQSKPMEAAKAAEPLETEGGGDKP
jgi:hypothetical protein